MAKNAPARLKKYKSKLDWKFFEDYYGNFFSDQPKRKRERLIKEKWEEHLRSVEKINKMVDLINADRAKDAKARRSRRARVSRR